MPACAAFRRASPVIVGTEPCPAATEEALEDLGHLLALDYNGRACDEMGVEVCPMRTLYLPAVGHPLLGRYETRVSVRDLEVYLGDIARYCEAQAERVGLPAVDADDPEAVWPPLPEED